MPCVEFTDGNAGDVVNMLGGYTVDATGRVDVSNNQRTDISYIGGLDGKRFRYEPVEYVGMRYFEIENLRCQ